MKKYKNIIFIIIFLAVLIPLKFSLAETSLLLDYPEIKGIQPGTESNLSEIIAYIYYFALGIAGVAALVVIIIGAAQYTFSAGNESQMSDAKNRIISAILGVILLLASVLILRVINPDLIDIGLNQEQLGIDYKGNMEYACELTNTSDCDGTFITGCASTLEACVSFCKEQAKNLGATASKCIEKIKEMGSCQTTCQEYSKRSYKCSIKNVPSCKIDGGSGRYVPQSACYETKDECKSFCKNKAEELGGEMEACYWVKTKRNCINYPTGCEQD
ncbi:MAG: hypothetical protein GF387_02860 [Candidatus Portnoybacteria bacterium]|nr:hypothetical protein [Candidatus Portnoybacteria bacterium]